jgi:cell pole-organizing protein PopZ
MNKPAPKEPSMDEILSSIRQIIADDDAAGAPRRPVLHTAPPPMQAAPAALPVEEDAGEAEDVEPLTLTSTQIVTDEDETEDEDLSFEALLADAATAEPVELADTVDLVDPEDIAFDPAPAELRVAPEASEPEPAFEVPEAEPVTPSMPDPTLSRDMAEELLEPATNAAVRSTFSKLSTLGLGTQGLTVEAMVREMLRPMLKEWLDENLPSVVERMVEKEIARISRGD